MGRNLTLSERRNISVKLTGIKRSSETRAKISLARTGRRHSQETRDKISKSNFGKKHPHREETKRRLSEIGKTKCGPLSSNWQGGKTPLGLAVRTSSAYKEWRTSVFRRDNYTCQGCGVRGETLNVDHIKPFSLIMKENCVKTVDEALACVELWDTINGRTLCFPCHRNTETWARGAVRILRKA